MGYEQHISRIDKEKQISIEELDNLIQTDKSLTLVKSDYNTIEWNEHPLGGIEGKNPLLYYSRGYLSSRHPDELVTKKMFELAKALNASLGDDEDTFDINYQNEIEQSCSKILRKQIDAQNRPWWKFW